MRNPSFEDEPQSGRPPTSWYFCGSPLETPPDIHPAGSFGVRTRAFHGFTYVGLVVRDNGTWERLGQQLAAPLEAGKTYWISMALARSETYRSRSRITEEPMNYNRPACLRIWGGQRHCEEEALLARSPTVDHPDWQVYEFTLHPQTQIDYLFLEAYFKENAKPYGGNLLVDGVSPILQLPPSAQRPQVEQIPKLFTQSKEQLESSLQTFFQNLELVAPTFFPKATFYRKQGTLHYANPALFALTEALFAFPNLEAKLIIHTDDKDRGRQIEKVLNQELAALGLRSWQLRTRVKKQKNRPKDSIQIQLRGSWKEAQSQD